MFAENKLALASVGMIVFIVLFCFVGPLLYHTDQIHTNLTDTLCQPSGSHPLGCDNVGYDELGRLMVGGQTSLEVGFAAAIVAVIIGTLYGAFSGFIGGPIDSFLMRIVDAGLSIPYIMVVVILSVVFHPDTVIMIFIIAVFYWLGVARLVRGEALSLRTREYVQAVRSWAAADPARWCGTSCRTRSARSSCRPPSRSPTRSLSWSCLGFLGLGVQPPATDWGGMLSGGLQYCSTADYWWLIYPPGIAIILILHRVQLHR